VYCRLAFLDSVHLELLLALAPVRARAAIHQPFVVKGGVLFFSVDCESERSRQLRAFVSGASTKLSLVYMLNVRRTSTRSRLDPNIAIFEFVLKCSVIVHSKNSRRFSCLSVRC